MKFYENGARYLLSIIYLFGAYDGACYLFFDIYLHGEPRGIFLVGLQGTIYFWALLKFVELIGGLSLFFNYKPALGTALLTPINVVLALFYFFEANWYIAFTIVVVCNLILLRAYSKSYAPLLDNYPWRKPREKVVDGDLELS